MLTEELIHPLFVENNLESMDDLMEVLNDVSARSQPSRLWVNCLIMPVLTIMKFIRAEREADWSLHISTAMADLLASHGLTGCDTVTPYFGIGEGVTLKVLRSNQHPLNYLGDTSIPLVDVIVMNVQD